jgi:hypothetical protein
MSVATLGATSLASAAEIVDLIWRLKGESG